ncbi:globin [Henriciella marina]|uniref:globin n=1 Tax=Henriciella marina TaxID=453851 RepID=UPI0003671FEC|nr:globin [Henriciella marina]
MRLASADCPYYHRQMEERAALIEDTLQRLADTVGDPQPLIYARLFALRPAFEAMFDLDSDGGVRAAMLETCFDCILGQAAGSPSPRFHLEAARLQHDGYGLTAEDLDLIFSVIRDVCRDTLGDDWTEKRDAAWTSLLDELARLTRETADS